MKILLAFSVLAILSGGILGFIAARGIVDWQNYLPIEKFAWTDISEGITQLDETPDPAEDTKEKEEPASQIGELETQLPAEPEGGTPEETAEPTAPAEAPEESADEHYAEFLDGTLLIIDDKAHVLSGSSIVSLLEKAKEASALSEYSIMLILTNDLFGMTIEEFAGEYYRSALERGRGESELTEDGFLFLVDAASNESCIAAFGAAGNRFSNSKKAEILEMIQPSLDADDFEAALMGLLENIPY